MLSFFRLNRLTVGYNPWQCKCLNDLLLWAGRNQVTYTSVTFNGERPVCVAVRNSTTVAATNSTSSCYRDMDWVTQNNVVQLYEEAVSIYEASKATEPSLPHRMGARPGKLEEIWSSELLINKTIACFSFPFVPLLFSFLLIGNYIVNGTM